MTQEEAIKVKRLLKDACSGILILLKNAIEDVQKSIIDDAQMGALSGLTQDEIEIAKEASMGTFLLVVDMIDGIFDTIEEKEFE